MKVPSSTPTAAYGTTRTPGVAYIEVERAAIALLKQGHRPSAERVRALLGRGSQQTLLSCLERFWRDLGARVEADPAAMSRLPPDIVELADGVWQRALTLAQQAKNIEGSAAEERLTERRQEVALRLKALEQREAERDRAMRAREATIMELRAQVSAVLGQLEAERATVAARDTQLADLTQQLAGERAHLTAILAAAVQRERRTRRTRPVAPVKPAKKALKKKRTRQAPSRAAGRRAPATRRRTRGRAKR